MKYNRVSFIIFIFLVIVFLLTSCSSATDSAKFAAKDAPGGMAEVELGRLAVQQASDPS